MLFEGGKRKSLREDVGVIGRRRHELDLERAWRLELSHLETTIFKMTFTPL